MSLPLTTLKGSIERITFYNEENGYTVARFVGERAEAASHEPITVVGNMLGVNIGEAVKLEGMWVTHPKHGRQFKVERFSVELPTTIEGIRKYLGSGLIKGIGPVTAERIVAHFSLETLDVIESNIERLHDVPGVGPKRVAMITKGWAEQRQIKEVMLFLQSYGVSTSLAVKIYKAYGDAALNVVRKQPYRLARDIYGIGFLTADKIARALGMKVDDPARIEAGVRHVLGQLSDDGHVFATNEELGREGTKALGVGADLVTQAIERLASTEEIMVEDDAVYLMPFYRAEVGVSNRLQQITNSRLSRLEDFRAVNWSKALEWLQAHSEIALTQKQQQAVRSALTEKVTILTGGPGTGKTTTVRGLIQLLKAKHHSFKLAAPTGRAAKRLSEATGEPAQTLHRLLEFKPHTEAGPRFLRDRDNPLDADLVIVDEVSMIDLLLMNSLLKALDITSHLLLVGDPDQLPSVGAGNVLRDLIASQTLPVIALDTIFRQSEESLIVLNAHRINRGEMPVFSKLAKDFFLFNVAEPEQAAQRVIKLVTTSIPNRFQLDPVEDIQVLSPMHRGVVGVGQLNLALQAALNPPQVGKREWRHGSRVFRVGDKVLQTRNNYDKQVFNGDLGRVVEIDLEDQRLAVNYEGVQITYDFGELDELTHAFALSVHKCVAEGTFVFTQHGVQTIESLWPPKGGIRFRPLSLHIVGKDGWGQTSQIYSGGKEPVITIQTRYGYTLTASYRHPVLVYAAASGQFIWEKMPEIKLGDWIPIQRAQCAFSDMPFPLAGFQIDDHSFGLRKPCRIPSHVDARLGSLLGYLMGDGSYHDRDDGGISFTNSDPRLVDFVRQSLKTLFGLDLTLNRSSAARTAPTYYVYNRTLRDLLLYLGLNYQRAEGKEVPMSILRSPRETQAAFLSALYDCDGSASGNSTRVAFTTASEKLAEQVQIMLLNFGIVAKRSIHWVETKRSGKRPYYRVEMFGHNLQLFLQMISFRQADKAAQLAHSVQRSERGAGSSNVEIIPGGQTLIRELKSAILAISPERTQGRKGAGLWGQLPFPIAKRFQALWRGQFRLAYHHLDLILPALKQMWPDIVAAPVYRRLVALQESRYFFDRVVKITKGHAQVYDLTVPGAENFTSNGFVSHNSQGSEYRAVVIPLMTQHYLMLQRNLLYTAVTRAKALVVLVGTKRAIAIAVHNDQIAQRNSRLDQRLRS